MSKNLKKEAVTALTDNKQVYFRHVRKNIHRSNISPEQDYEYPTGISETVPDQAVDLRLMLNRAKSGQIVAHREGVYHTDDLPELYKMDDVELMQYRMELADNMARMSQDLHDATKALELKQSELALEQAVQNRLKDEQKKEPETAPKA